ncbi:Rabenosyn-5 [Trametes pubescens]|uniref:Rabenosyn-5 n=1 Tax=Trametes pubescens TaxID=154538 RepID=A0A1M2VJQ6_TRAPU|nr:Rabenosyn-5 [Trametes pubescens]
MENPPYVPYQAYKSKRHSRGLSNQQSIPNIAPAPVQSRPGAALSNGHTYSESAVSQSVDGVADAEKQSIAMLNGRGTLQRPVSMIETFTTSRREPSPAPQHVTRTSISKPLPPPAPIPVPELHNLDQPVSPLEPRFTAVSSPAVSSAAPSPPPASTPPSHAASLPSSPSSQASQISSPKANGKAIAQLSPIAGPSTLSPALSDRPLASPRKSSTFRHVRPPSARPSAPSSPLRPTSTHVRSSSAMVSSPLRPPDARLHDSVNGVSSTASTPNMPALERALPPIPAFELHSQTPPSRSAAHSPNPVAPAGPPPRTSSLGPTGTQQHIPPPHSATPPVLTPSTSNSSAVTVVSRVSGRSPAPYRPGFQPKGVYRQRTDEFIESRAHSRDVGKIERTRLERRLEKLIQLHFPLPGQRKEEAPQQRPTSQNRRASSFWDLDFSDLKNKSAGDLWRGVLQTQASSQGTKNDIRAAEQKITPWEDDAAVSQCPLCTASFHPLTNRKHHCRLCGRIVCSLPVKYPQRPETCSLLFVADQSTGRIEEVGEGVDYGVRRRTPSNAGKKGEVLSEEEKFLKGVRICRECRPVLLRQQYRQELVSTPLFSRLYEAFISLEKEIEEELPVFQELMISLSKQERPTPEASAARKRLLEAFAQYDTFAKRIRKLPCAPGSSQDRIQNAVLTRANIFLQKHMFPLQALPKPKKAGGATSPGAVPQEDQIIDPDSEVARVLQPLLEQEALLETFVEEAKAHRKFEDLKTLKSSLREIRAEIERILANAEEQASSGRRARTSTA